MSLLSTIGDVASNLTPIGGVVNAFKSLFGGSGMSQKDLLRWQEQQLQKQFDFQSTEAQKNRDFQADQADISRDWNSIGSQLNRARNAGVNPYALVGSGSYGSAAGSPTPSGAMAGGVSVPMPATPSERLQGLQGLSLVANAMDSIASAKQRGADTALTERSLNEIVRGLQLDNQGKELANGIQSIILKYQDRISSRQAEKLFQEIGLITEQALTEDYSRREILSRISLNLAQTDFTKAQRDEVLRYVNVWMDRIEQSKVDAAQSEVKKNLSAAGMFNAQAYQAMTQGDLNKSVKRLQDLNYGVQSATAGDQILATAETYRQELERQGVLTEQMRVQLEQAIKNKNWTEVKNICQGFYQVAAGVSMLRGAPAVPDIQIENEGYSVDSHGRESHYYNRTRKSSK